MIRARAQSRVPEFVFYITGASLTLAYTAPPPPPPLSSEAAHPGDRWVLSVLGSHSPLAPPSFSLGRWRGRCVTPLCAMRFHLLGEAICKSGSSLILTDVEGSGAEVWSQGPRFPPQLCP